MSRKAISRVTNRELIERDAHWSEGAREWVRQMALGVFADATRELTCAEVMARLDMAPPESIPPGYVRLSSTKTYPDRYQLVRGVLEAMRRDAILEAGTTVNAKGREDVTCYRAASQLPPFEVYVEGPRAPEVKNLFEAWLSKNGNPLAGHDLLIKSLAKKDVSVVTQTPGGVTDEARAKTAGRSKSRTKAAS